MCFIFRLTVLLLTCYGVWSTNKHNNSNTTNIVLNFQNIGATYDGMGALSAGATTRMLIDYGEPQRSQILDYLFKPNFGAQLQILKTEIPGDTWSTDGSEPSHMHSRNDLSCTRGYEGWLMAEAKKRNPNITLFALSWGAPGWIGNHSFYSADNIQYHIEWLKCMKNMYALDIDYIGNWNEAPWGGPSYTLQLKHAMVVAGFKNVKFGLMLYNSLYNTLQNNASLRAIVPVAGTHYPCKRREDGLAKMGVKYWALEDWSTKGDWSGGGCWGRILNQNFININATATIAWALEWSAPVPLHYDGSGFLYAQEPWSGHYDVQPPIWISAHWGQFSSIGWKLLNASEDGGSGFLPDGGSYVTVFDDGGSGDFSIIIETLEGNCHKTDCNCENTTKQNLTFQLKNPLLLQGKDTLYVWQTNETHYFVQQGDITIVKGVFNVTIDRDTMITLTTLSTGHHGSHSPIPPSTPFPSKYSDDFTSYAEDSTPKYFADQYGTFAVRRWSDVDKNNALVQVVPRLPIEWHRGDDMNPITLIGDGLWTEFNATVSVNVNSSQASSYVLVSAAVPDRRGVRPSPCALFIYSNGTVSLGESQRIIPNFDSNAWYDVFYEVHGINVTGSVRINDKVYTQQCSAKDLKGLLLGTAYNYGGFRNLTMQQIKQAFNM